MNPDEARVDINSLSLQIEQRDSERVLIAQVYGEFPLANFFILDEDIRLEFKIAGKETTLHELKMSMGARLQNIPGNPTSVRFYSPLPQSSIEKIENQRRGHDLVLNLNINNVTYAPIDGTTGTFGKISRFYWSPTKTSEVKVYTAREWIDTVLKKTGYGDRLILEIPVTFPHLDASLPSQQTSLSELGNRLVRAIADIQRAHEEYLNHRNDSCIDRVREASDSLRTFIDKESTLSEELLTRTATCTKNVAPELFESLTTMVNSIFSLSSKGIHAVTKRGESMDYRPDSEDAELLVGAMSAIVAYLATKLEKRTKLEIS